MLMALGGAGAPWLPEARARLAAGVPFDEAVLNAGASPEAFLAVACRVCRVQPVPNKWLERPKPPSDPGADGDLYRALRAAPVGRLRGELCVAFANPEDISSPRVAGLPPHKAFLASGADVTRLLALTFGSPPLPSGNLAALSEHSPTVFEPHLAPPDEDLARADAFHRLGAPDATLAIEAVSAPPGAVAELPTGQARAVPPTAQALAQSGIDEARKQALARLPRFAVRGVLGRGGMATVYLAHDADSDRDVALKLMEPHLAEDPRFVERFRREIKASASLDHPNVVRLYDAGVSGEAMYMASEYVGGGTLRDLLQRTGPMPPALVAPLLAGALAGLGHAHERGLVHRDLKPANLLLGTDGTLKIGDFGVAKSQTDNTLTATGMLFGTPAYMSPEQAFGKPLDGRSDLFSLATLAYELLTGRNPFHHDNASTSLLLVSRVQAPPLLEVAPALPLLLEEVLSRLLERLPEQRFKDAAEALTALRPLTEAVATRWGTVLRDAVQAPAQTAQRLRLDQADDELRLAEALLAEEEPPMRQAALRLFRATTLVPDHPAAARKQALEEKHGYSFSATPDASLAELVAGLEDKPNSPALLRRGAEMSLAKGRLLVGAVWLVRYLRLSPGDLHMRHTLAGVLGEDPLAPFGAPPPPELASSPPGAPAPAFELPDWVLPAHVQSRAPAASLAPPARRSRRLPAAAAVGALALAGVLVVALARGGSRGAPLAELATPAAAQGQADPRGNVARLLGVQHSRINAADALAAQGKLAEAAAAYGTAFEVDPGSDLAATALLGRAKVFMNLRRLREARADLDKAQLLVEPHDPRHAEAARLLEGM
jgi:tetratricopeptide (TPR) repeat protein